MPSRESGADCVGRPQPLDVAGATPCSGPSPPRGRRGWAIIRPRTFTRTARVSCRRRAWRSPIAAGSSTRSACSTSASTPARTWSSIIASPGRGCTCWFTPRVQVHYHPRSSLSGLFRQMMRYGRGRVRLLRKHPDTFSLPGFVPAAFLAGVVAGPLLACWSSLLALLYLGVLGVYGCGFAAVQPGYRHAASATCDCCRCCRWFS